MDANACVWMLMADDGCSRMLLAAGCLMDANGV